MSTMRDAGPSMPLLRCAGCGTEVEAMGTGGVASRCPRAGNDDVDHVLRPVAPGTFATLARTRRAARIRSSVTGRS